MEDCSFYKFAKYFLILLFFGIAIHVLPQVVKHSLKNNVGGGNYGRDQNVGNSYCTVGRADAVRVYSALANQTGTEPVSR